MSPEPLWTTVGRIYYGYENDKITSEVHAACVCGWRGEDRGDDWATARKDAKAHREKGCKLGNG